MQTDDDGRVGPFVGARRADHGRGHRHRPRDRAASRHGGCRHRGDRARRLRARTRWRPTCAPSAGAAETRAADVSDGDGLAAAIDDLAAALGPLHVAHANAGTLTQRAALTDLDLGEWNRVLAVDLTGVMLTFRAAVPHFSSAGGVLLASGSSLAIRPGVGLLPYVAAKAGVHAMARSLALELAPRGIRVNVIAPGLTDTPMTRAIEGHIELGLATVPTGQLVHLTDIAALAVHLMTDEARSVTGSVFTVDVGRTAV